MPYTGTRGYIPNINLLFHLSYYHGMISGVASINDYKVYFDQISRHLLTGKHEIHSSDAPASETWFTYYLPEIDTPELNDRQDEPGLDGDIIRFFYVYDISQEAMDTLLKRQELFEDYVGNHSRYVNNTRNRETDTGPRLAGGWDAYKEKSEDMFFDAKKELTFRNRIGYFDSNTIIQSRKKHI